MESIAREGANWFENKWNQIRNQTKETVEIPITSLLDGSRVTRENYISICSRQED